jgi:hypothetical protein
VPLLAGVQKQRNKSQTLNTCNLYAGELLFTTLPCSHSRRKVLLAAVCVALTAAVCGPAAWFLWFYRPPSSDVLPIPSSTTLSNVLRRKPPSIFDLDTIAVPRIIWQTAKSHHKAPQAGVECFDSWTKLNPEYDHFLLDDEEVDQFVKLHFNASVLEGFRAMPLGVMRADVFRYAPEPCGDS